MAFFTNALRVEQPLGKIQQGFPAVGGLCYWYTVCWQGTIACALRKKVEGGGPTACLEYLLGNKDGGVGATGCLRYCYQRLREPREGERAWNICLEKGTGELVPRGACDIATNFSGSPGKGSVLGLFAWK